MKGDARGGPNAQGCAAIHLCSRYLWSALTLGFSSDQKSSCSDGAYVLLGGGVGKQEMDHVVLGCGESDEERGRAVRDRA